MAEAQSAKAARIRREAAKKPGSATGKAGDGVRPLTPTDNLSAEDKRRAQDAAEEAALLSYLSVIRVKQKAVDEAKAVHDAAKAEVNAVYGTAKNAGFPRNLLQEIIRDSAVKGQRRNIEEAERKRAKFRKWVGLPVGNSDEQRELEARLPETQRNEIEWEADGYRAGVAAEAPKPPNDCVKAGFDQAWLKGYGNGQSRNAWALSEAKGLTPMPGAAPNPPAAPKEPAPPQDPPPPEPIGEKPAETFREDTPEELAAQVRRPQPEVPEEAV